MRTTWHRVSASSAAEYTSRYTALCFYSKRVAFGHTWTRVQRRYVCCNVRSIALQRWQGPFPKDAMFTQKCGKNGFISLVGNAASLRQQLACSALANVCPNRPLSISIVAASALERTWHRELECTGRPSKSFALRVCTVRQHLSTLQTVLCVALVA